MNGIVIGSFAWGYQESNEERERAWLKMFVEELRDRIESLELV
jgi:hypothetical protein